MKQKDGEDEWLLLSLRNVETKLVNSFLFGSEFPYELQGREHRRERVRLS